MSQALLAGERVVVTRAVHQAAGLVAAFTAAGADVARLPLLELGPPADPAPLIGPARRAADFAGPASRKSVSSSTLAVEVPHRLRGTDHSTFSPSGSRMFFFSPNPFAMIRCGTQITTFVEVSRKSEAASAQSRKLLPQPVGMLTMTRDRPLAVS